MGSSQNNTANDVASSAFGRNNTASGEASSAVGFNNTVSGVDSSAFGSGNTASGNNAIAMGTSSMAINDRTVAAGFNAVASGIDSMAYGTNSQALGADSVALGSNSVAVQDNAVSIGNPGNERRITNQAPGINPTDGVNVSQLNSMTNSLSARYDQITAANRRRASQGVAGAVAIASLPSIHETAHKYQISAGVGGFDGYAAAAIGLEMQPIENLQFRVAYAIAKNNNAIGGGLGFSW